ncbi:MAG TPA: AAA family ATPase [Thermomicrobiaceae bacterium]|nr:AAA family ATPase [Thermomicrobiaceae bacterium]
MAVAEAVIFTGIQGAGKTTFYVERFLHTHVRISLDLLRTRNRERTFLDACLATRQPFVVDNTNPSAADRARYLVPARAAGFAVVCYAFESPPAEAARRNAARAAPHRVPTGAVFGTHRRLERPAWSEGFDALFTVTISPDGRFDVRAVEHPAPPVAPNPPEPTA